MTDRPRASDGWRSTAADGGYRADQSRPDPACRAKTCAVVNDCCTCAAYDPGPPTPLPYCPAACETSTCDAINLGSLTSADAYCLNGHCLLATKSCAGDADCVLVDDCCSCLAAPRKHGIPQCLADCNTSKCVAMGLGQARARCSAGRCQLSLD